MVSIHFLIQPVWHHPVKGVRAQVLTIQINQLSSMNHPLIASNLKFHIDGEFHQYFSFSNYLVIPTRLLSATLDYTMLLDHRLVLFASHIYCFEFENSRPAQILTRISGIKTGYSTIVLCFFHYIFLIKYKIDWNYS